MPKKIRWWPAVLVVLLWLGAVGWFSWAGERTGQERTLAVLGVTAMALGLLFLWFLLLSRLPWRGRLLGALGVVGLGFLAAQTVEIRGVSGDLLPVLAFKWTPRAGSQPLSPPAAAPEVPGTPSPEVPGTSETPPEMAPEMAGTPAAPEVPGTHPQAPGEPPPAEPSPEVPGTSVASPEMAGTPVPEVAGTSRTLAGAADWPGFLGPRRDGSAPDVRLARDWQARPPRQVWRIPVGAGWAGFAVVGGRAFTIEQHGEEEVATAYDLATGVRLWSHADRARYETTIGGLGPRSTPTVAEGRLFVMGATGRLRALDAASGRLLWLRDTLADNGAENPEWGKSVSPLVVDGRVVVGAGGPAGRSVVAYDAGTGEPAWAGGDDGPSFSSPIVATLAGVRQVVSFNANSLTGHSLDDGRVLWRYPWSAQQPNVSVPLVLPEDRLFASSGYGVGAKVLQIATGENGTQTANLVWESPRLKAKFTNVVQHGGRLYGLDDGTLVCLDPATGERCWKAGRYGHGQVILVGDLLLVATEEGELVLVEPVPEELRVLDTWRLFDGKTWNPPTLAGRYLLARTDREAVLLELPVRE
ncbi:MAG TPA: PQQ-binding-like beta-propeller repeat protein [Thermoanaerobaculia bacterium]|nr:PQQ-binding-like beta-propeller repeat protein [Thermoanaerobaculia bacterium]